MSQPKFHLAQRDAVAWLREFDAESVDLVITDPPYESLEKHRAVGTTTRLKHSKASSNDWFSIFPNTRFPELFEQVYRVLRKHSHFYLYCDPETMFVAKPLAEKAGFKFWKPLVWDKCLGPDTLVWTERGVVRIADVVAGDRVAIPEGGTAVVKATRKTRAPALRFVLGDGAWLVASHDHRFVRADGAIVEARDLEPGARMLARPVRARVGETLVVREAPAMIEIASVSDVGDRDLVDVAIDHPDELFLLANGLVTHNCTIGMGYHYRARYECVLFFEKGKRKLADLGIADIIEHKRVVGGYPAEKPPEVSEVLIQQSTARGDLVIDPFCGSGSVGVAAIRHGRAFAGNDLCAEAVAISRERLRDGGAVEVRAPAAMTAAQPGQLGLGV